MSKKSITWKNQWERVMRLAGWLDEIYSTENQLEQNRASDVAYSFFINCFHLKDWISNYDSSLKTGVNNLFNREIGEEHLKICADIANGAKHFQLDKRRRTNQEPRVTAKSVNINQSGGVAYRFILGDYDAQELKNKCMNEWGEYLQSNDLI